MRDMASDAFGIDIDDDDVPLTAEAMAAMLDAKLDAAQAAEDEAQSRKPPPQKKGNAKARARQAEAEKIAEGASRSIREVYRRLASELHPDREPDAAERARKTELMQRVNVAYEAGDLLALLELQLSIEQINPEALAGMADERIKHYNQVLQEQSNRLSDEIFDITEPFMTMLGKMSTYGVTPESVDRSLNAEISALKKALKAINGDLVRFQDLRVFKADLRYYQINRVDDFDDPFGGPIPDEARKIVQELIAKEMAALVRKQRKK